LPGPRLGDALLIGVIGIVLIVPLLRRILARRFDPFEPYVLFVAAYSVMFVIRPAAMLITDSQVVVGPLSTLDISSTFTEMLVVALLGAVAFASGYELPAGRRLAQRQVPPPAVVDQRRLLVAAALVALAGVIAFATVLVWVDGWHAFVSIFRLGRSADVGEAIETYRYAWMAFLFLIPAAMVFLAVGLHRRSKAILAVFLCLSALLLLRAIPLGQRISLLPFLGGAIVLWYTAHSKRPSLRMLVALALVALFVSAFLSDLRGRHDRHETLAQTIARATSPPRVARSLSSGPDSEMAAVLAAALSVIPERLPHTYGATIFGDLAVRGVPRPLWRSKPQPPRKELISTLWPTEAANGGFRPEFSVLLYFYWDFSFLGVVFGLAIYGVGARYLYEYYLRYPNHLYVQVFYALSLWFVVVGLRDSPVDTVVRAAFIVAPVWALFRLARRSTRLWPSKTLSRMASPIS
jgi:hypothetical protein